MGNPALVYLGAALTLIWGVAHLFPTRGVIRGFGDISTENRRIVAMEWIIEGVALIFIGILVATVCFLDAGGDVSTAVYLLSALNLFTLALVSLFTGFRIAFLPFRLCPFIFFASALLIAVGGLFGTSGGS